MRAILALALACVATTAFADDVYVYGQVSPVVVSNYGRPLLVTSYPSYSLPVAYYNWPAMPSYVEPATYAFAVPATSGTVQIAGPNAVAYLPAGYWPTSVYYRAPPSLPVTETPAARTAEAGLRSTLR
jgi:hypothetical protein